MPEWAAVVFAVLLIVLVPRAGSPESLWLQERPTAVTPGALVRDLTLVAGNGGLASPLWSLRWEVLFSLAIPLYIGFARKLVRVPVPLVVGFVGLVAVGGFFDESILLYAPMFMVGVVMALRVNDLLAFLGRVPAAAWALIFAASIVACSAPWLMVYVGGGDRLAGAAKGLALVGATGVVLTALGFKPLVRWLETGVAQWFGRISFSLYLVHEPIVVTLGYSLPSPVMAIALGVPLSLLMGAGFYRFVELPSHRLAKRVRRLQQSRVSEPMLNVDAT